MFVAVLLVMFLVINGAEGGSRTHTSITDTGVWDQRVYHSATSAYKISTFLYFKLKLWCTTGYILIFLFPDIKDSGSFWNAWLQPGPQK